MKLPVGIHQFRPHRRIIEARQSASGDGIEKLLLEQLLAERPQAGRAAINQGLQRDLAEVEIDLRVKRDFLHRIERATVAKKHAQVTDAVAQHGVR